MASSIPINHKKNQPEEKLRRQLLFWMIQEGGYPETLIVSEKKLDFLEHIPSGPNRRFDICVMQQCKKNGLKPLLLVECKRHKPTPAAAHQLVAYNFYLKAPYIALATPFGCLYSSDHSTWQSGFPKYSHLRELQNSLCLEKSMIFGAL